MILGQSYRKFKVIRHKSKEGQHLYFAAPNTFSSFADCINDNGEEDYSCSRRDIEIIGNEQPAQTAKVAYANGQPNDAVEPV